MYAGQGCTNVDLNWEMGFSEYMCGTYIIPYPLVKICTCSQRHITLSIHSCDAYLLRVYRANALLPVTLSTPIHLANNAMYLPRLRSLFTYCSCPEWQNCVCVLTVINELPSLPVPNKPIITNDERYSSVLAFELGYMTYFAFENRGCGGGAGRHRMGQDIGITGTGFFLAWD